MPLVVPEIIVSTYAPGHRDWDTIVAEAAEFAERGERDNLAAVGVESADISSYLYRGAGLEQATSPRTDPAQRFREGVRVLCELPSYSLRVAHFAGERAVRGVLIGAKGYRRMRQAPEGVPAAQYASSTNRIAYLGVPNYEGNGHYDDVTTELVLDLLNSAADTDTGLQTTASIWDGQPNQRVLEDLGFEARHNLTHAYTIGDTAVTLTTMVRPPQASFRGVAA